MEDLLRQQQEDRERIRALEKQLNAMDIRVQQRLDALQQEGAHLQGCCNTVSDLQNRITDAERKISSASENFDILQKRLNMEVSRLGGDNVGEIGGDRKYAVITEDRLDNRLKDLEQRINSTVQHTEQSCSYLENDLKDYFSRKLSDLRTVFLDRFDDQAFRIVDVELDIGLVKDRVSDLNQKLSKLENNTSLMNQRLEKCSCGRSEEGRRKGDGEDGGKTLEGGRETTGGISGDKGGGLSGVGEERENPTEKSLEWRVVANEDQIRHFNTRLKNLSVSGDSLHDKVSCSPVCQCQSMSVVLFNVFIFRSKGEITNTCRELEANKGTVKC